MRRDLRVSSNPKTSPTHIEQDWRCRRERYWGTVFKGQGIRKIGIDPDKEVGIRFHGAAATFVNTWVQNSTMGYERRARFAAETAIDHLRTAYPNLTEPWQTWLEAMIWAWGTRVWPELMTTYDVVSAEERIVFTREGVDYKCFPDLVLRHKVTGLLWVYDFKTFSYWDQRKWIRAVQLQIVITAVEQVNAGSPVEGSIIQGISKGTVREDQLHHPLVFGYKREAETTTYSFRWKRGYVRFPVTAYPGGIRAWIEECPAEIVADLFPQTQPIFANRTELAHLYAQRATRELDIEAAREAETSGVSLTAAELDELFPQNFSACESDRFKCAMFEACHIPTVTKDPVASGLYELRFHKEKPNADGSKR